MTPPELNTRIKTKLDGIKKHAILADALNSLRYYFLETQLADANKRINYKFKLLNSCIVGLFLINLMILFVIVLDL